MDTISPIKVTIVAVKKLKIKELAKAFKKYFVNKLLLKKDLSPKIL